MLNYNAPINGDKSSIDVGTNSDQKNVEKWLKNSLIEAKKKQVFMPLADVKTMPKHYGKKISVYEYVPLLDDRNINNQGINAAGVTIANGNLYGSSKDTGTIIGALPVLGENGGKVNRVGWSRYQREGELQKFGFHYSFTKEALDFDTDDQLLNHLSREMVNGAHEVTEDVLQKDLLTAATTIVYSGAATSDSTVTGETVGATPASVVTYATLMRLDQILNENRTPRQTTILSGSRMTDTKVIGSARYLFIGSELVPLIRGIKDLFGNQAFIPVQHYASQTTPMTGEIGSIDAFRIVVAPEMQHSAGKGATVGTNPGYRATNGKYNIYPMLVVGEGAFTTIGFQTGGDSYKFSVITKMPGRETADIDNDPFGERGFSSIKWYYGFMALRPERLGLIKTVAPI